MKGSYFIKKLENLHLTEGSLIVMRMSPLTPPDITNQAAQILGHVLRSMKIRHVSAVLLRMNDNLKVFDENKMNKLGWYRQPLTMPPSCDLCAMKSASNSCNEQRTSIGCKVRLFDNACK